ncbi:DEKNAAC104499 [Brettanomyces naardenensis]|uniref:cysteine-S-conjugate beta-lyase n=1 Tax=Brettanomyces naardenensis TaxID=13370 RepID=A0A448YR24_BRENA|nr:DEKNAAC104499 [Brettanomyces naardenensis]
MTADKGYRFETEVVRIEQNDRFGSSAPPLYQSATFRAQDATHAGEFEYTRIGNPTRTILQDHVAKLIGCKYVLAVNSGMACLDVITRLLEPGDELICGQVLYSGSDRLMKQAQKKSAVDLRHEDLTDFENVKTKVTKRTKMIIIESPTNPLMQVVDVRKITEFAHSVNPECIVVCDNTMNSPLLMKPLDLGVDIHYESGTKYLNGHHDLMAGVIASNRKELIEEMHSVIESIGSGLSPFDSWLLLRGIKTLVLRMERVQQNAIQLARWLESQSFKVRYPGLKSHPQYELQRSQAAGSGALFSIETGDVKLSERIVANCKIFFVTISFGCVNSLISMPFREEATGSNPRDLIRICVGIENIQDLIDDMDQAIRKARRFSDV